MLILGIKLFLISLCGLLYRLGGKDGFSKGFRRFGCPSLILISLIISKNYIGIISIPFIMASLLIGYGYNSKMMKLFKNKYIVRFVCGFAYSVSTLAIFWGSWWLYSYHVVFTTIGVMLAGNQKFNWDDKREEAFVGCIVGLIPILGM